MHPIELTLAILLICTGLVVETKVVEYTDENFSSGIVEHEAALVMFYAPWCGHCKKLKPEFEKAAKKLMKVDPPIVLVKVDCTIGGKETCSKHSVSGYPTLKIFKKGEFHKEYSGPRDSSGIVKYMKSQVGTPSKEITSFEDFLKLNAAGKEASIIGFFEKDATELKEAYFKAAEKERDTWRFGHVTDPKLFVKEGVGIYLYRPAYLNSKFEDRKVQYGGEADSDKIISFIKEHQHGLLGLRDYDNKDTFKNPLVVAYFSVDYRRNAKGTTYWRNRILKVAAQYSGKLKFAFSNIDDFSDELDSFGIEDTDNSKKPIVTAVNAKNQKFAMKEEFSVENLEKFVKEFMGGKLNPHLKSQNIVEDDGPVKVAVAKNFDEVVTNNGKDTMVEFYAPWCGHCKQLEPVYETVAKTLADEEVVLVKMDATENDIPFPYEVNGYPTLYWVKKDRKADPILYDEGSKKFNDLIKYIAKHATEELKGFDRSGKVKEKLTKEEEAASPEPKKGVKQTEKVSEKSKEEKAEL